MDDNTGRWLDGSVLVGFSAISLELFGLKTSLILAVALIGGVLALTAAGDLIRHRAPNLFRRWFRFLS
jgi:hypothetical protein